MSSSVVMATFLVGSAAPIAAFMATKAVGRAGPAPCSKAERPKQSGGWRGRLFCFAMQSALLHRAGAMETMQGAAENSRQPPLPGRTV
jgi:hypothetical protein